MIGVASPQVGGECDLQTTSGEPRLPAVAVLRDAGGAEDVHPALLGLALVGDAKGPRMMRLQDAGVDLVMILPSSEWELLRGRGGRGDERLDEWRASGFSAVCYLTDTPAAARSDAVWTPTAITVAGGELRLGGIDGAVTLAEHQLDQLERVAAQKPAKSQGA